MKKVSPMKCVHLSKKRLVRRMLPLLDQQAFFSVPVLQVLTLIQAMQTEEKILWTSFSI